MNKQHAMDRFFSLMQIPIREMSSDGIRISAPTAYAEVKDPVYSDKDLFRNLYDCYQERRQPSIYMEEDIYLYALFEWEENLYILGPMGLSKPSRYQCHEYYQKHKVKESSGVMQYIVAMNQFEEITCFIYELITGIHLEEWFLDKRDKERQEKIIYEERAKYHFEIYENNVERAPYQMELEWLKSIEEGSYEEKGREIIRKYGNLNIGKMAQKSSKQAEYMAVGAIMLATRAAIRGGLDPIKAYEMGDIRLQQLERTNITTEIYKLITQSVQDFSDEVKKLKDLQSYNNYIEKCKTYIAKNIHGRIYLKDIGNELGINPSYLSRIFSQSEGTTISEYILREKVKIACNLLKYSDETVVRIAEYMSFYSQSYFTLVFKKHMGITPLQFRLQNKFEDFMQ